MDKKEYNRNYYYKRDKTKLKQYRDKYNKKIKKREYYRLHSKIQKAEKYFRNHGRFQDKETELLVQEYRKPKEYSSKWYRENRLQLLEKMNADYRDKKLKEFTDNVLNIPEDNIVDNYGRR